MGAHHCVGEGLLLFTAASRQEGTLCGPKHKVVRAALGLQVTDSSHKKRNPNKKTSWAYLQR